MFCGRASHPLKVLSDIYTFAKSGLSESMTSIALSVDGK